MIIARYIFKSCLAYTLLTLLACIILFATLTIIGELGNLGKGDFNSLALIIFIAASLPSFAYLLMPLAVLIGVMLAMLNLVNYSEYAVIRTSGVSLKYITAILFMFGLMFSIFTFIIGEYIAPKSDHFAKVYHISKTKQIMTTQLHSGIWSKDGDNNFVNIKQVMPDDTIVGIDIFKYNSNLQLQKYILANSGVFNKTNGTWTLHDVTINDYTNQNMAITHNSTYTWKSSIAPSYFDFLVVAPEDMSALELIRYMHHLDKNNQSTQRYQVAFWNKLLYPIACLSMAVLAIAFIPTNRRNINLSTKLFLGLLIGFAFFFSTKLIGFMALLYNWNAILSATGPTAILFISGWIFILKKKD